MICKKCNSEIPEGARFCPNCGFDTAKRESQVNKSEETLPIQVFFDSFAKHKKIYISIIVLIVASCVGVYFYSNYQKKKEAERELISIFESSHLFSYLSDNRNPKAGIVSSAVVAGSACIFVC